METYLQISYMQLVIKQTKRQRNWKKHTKKRMAWSSGGDYSCIVWVVSDAVHFRDFKYLLQQILWSFLWEKYFCFISTLHSQCKLSAEEILHHSENLVSVANMTNDSDEPLCRLLLSLPLVKDLRFHESWSARLGQQLG